MARPMGFSASVHACALRQPAGHALSPRPHGRFRRRTRWGTTWRGMRSSSTCPFARGSPSKGSRVRATASSCQQGIFVSRRPTSSSRRERTGSRRSRCSRRSSIRGSCSFTRSNTATLSSCSRATRCSWARATRERRSPTSWRIPGTVSSRPEHRADPRTSRQPAEPSGLPGLPVSWDIMCSGSTRASVASSVRSSLTGATH